MAIYDLHHFDAWWNSIILYRYTGNVSVENISGDKRTANLHLQRDEYGDKIENTDE